MLGFCYSSTLENGQQRQNFPEAHDKHSKPNQTKQKTTTIATEQDEEGENLASSEVEGERQLEIVP